MRVKETESHMFHSVINVRNDNYEIIISLKIMKWNKDGLTWYFDW